MSLLSFYCQLEASNFAAGPQIHTFVTISLLTFLPFYVTIYMKVEGKQRKTRKAIQ